MRKEYFLTAPLLQSPTAIHAGDCIIHLCGREGYSFMEGPTQMAIDAIRDDFVCVVAELVPSATVSFRIVLRCTTEPSPIVFESKSGVPQDWKAWAFSRIPLKEIPLVSLDEDTCKQLGRALNENRA